MKTEELSFIGGDPGAAKFGNFINYYSFHSTTERIKSLHPDMFEPMPPESILCLDIGCNTGELTKELYNYLVTSIYPNCNIQMLAVDIDPVLVKRAEETNDSPNLKFIMANIMEDIDREVIEKYLKSFNKNAFDITFCFSVTMWIHINNGDKGLLGFLEYVKDVSRTIIIEPQPWKCYRNAQRRMKKNNSLFPLYEQLKIRCDVDSVIEEYLSKDSHKKVYESLASSWNRKIQSHQRVDQQQ